MTKYFLQNLLSIVLLLGSFTIACNGQLQSNPQTNISKVAKPSPIIIGTPPPRNPIHNPYNDSGLVSQYIRTIFEDSQGNFWFGPAGESVARYDGKTLRYFSRADFFEGNSTLKTDNGNSIHATAEDLEGNIWFGTHVGLVKYNGKTFKSYTEKDGLGSVKIGRRGILCDSKGDLWVGTAKGVFKYNLEADQKGEACFSQFPEIPSIPVVDIFEDLKGQHWFASKSGGLYVFNGSTIENINNEAGLGPNPAGAIAQDKEGNYWFTTLKEFCKYDGTNFTYFTTEDGLGGSEVWDLYVEKSGIIWITSRGSTTRFDPTLPKSEAFKVYTPDDGLNCCVQSMYQDKTGNMWWGTGQGLYQYDGTNFYQVKQNGPWY